MAAAELVSVDGVTTPGLAFAVRRTVMSIISWIVVGILAGWIAERITGRNHGLLTNLVVGIIGAFVGGFIFSSLLGLRLPEPAKP